MVPRERSPPHSNAHVGLVGPSETDAGGGFSNVNKLRLQNQTLQSRMGLRDVPGTYLLAEGKGPKAPLPHLQGSVDQGP